MIAKCKKCGGNAEISERNSNTVTHECWPEYRAFMMSVEAWNSANALQALSEKAVQIHP